jgi:hypothetical protein
MQTITVYDKDLPVFRLFNKAAPSADIQHWMRWEGDYALWNETHGKSSSDLFIGYMGFAWKHNHTLYLDNAEK